MKKSLKSLNFYARLGLEDFVDDQSVIKKKYRSSMMRLHPDKVEAAAKLANPNITKEELQAVLDSMLEEAQFITQAYQTLSDLSKKDRYDKGLKYADRHSSMPEQQSAHTRPSRPSPPPRPSRPSNQSFDGDWRADTNRYAREAQEREANETPEEKAEREKGAAERAARQQYRAAKSELGQKHERETGHLNSKQRAERNVQTERHDGERFFEHANSHGKRDLALKYKKDLLKAELKAARDAAVAEAHHNGQSGHVLNTIRGEFAQKIDAVEKLTDIEGLRTTPCDPEVIEQRKEALEKQQLHERVELRERHRAEGRSLEERQAKESADLDKQHGVEPGSWQSRHAARFQGQAR